MRKDVLEGVEVYIMQDMKPNYAELARLYDCDPRTVKAAYQRLKSGESASASTKRKVKKSILDPYKEIIHEKLDLQCTAKSIFWFIQKKGYQGSYSLVRQYCQKHKGEKKRKATIRVETSPGLSAQVDWKEEMTLYSCHGEKMTINIFLLILGYSRLKFMKLTVDRKQDTLFECLSEAFSYCEGVPKEIWFDNMPTVVNREKSRFGKPVLNERFYQFSKNAGFHPITCRPYRPQTKGKVEALARTVERLTVLNGEFETLDDLKSFVKELNEDLNHEISQATQEKPYDLWLKEKEYLNFYQPELLKPFFQENITRIVSKESMVLFRNHKYSVPTYYIGKTVDIKISDDSQQVHIYYNGQRIRKHDLSEKLFNYHKEDRVDILKSDVFAHKTEGEIEHFILNDLTRYDQLGAKNDD